MSAIQQYLDDIKTAVYGEEVRGSIHDAIEQCYEDVTAAKTIADDSVRDMADTVANAKIDINNTRDAGVQTVNEAKTTAVQTVNQTKTTALDDIQDKIDDATEDLNAVKQAASDAEAYAKGTRKGSAVPDTDPAYENNAKYFYEQTSQNLIDTNAAKTATIEAKNTAVNTVDSALEDISNAGEVQVADIQQKGQEALDALQAYADLPEDVSNLKSAMPPITPDAYITKNAYIQNGNRDIGNRKLTIENGMITFSVVNTYNKGFIINKKVTEYDFKSVSGYLADYIPIIDDLSEINILKGCNALRYWVEQTTLASRPREFLILRFYNVIDGVITELDRTDFAALNQGYNIKFFTIPDNTTHYVLLVFQAAANPTTTKAVIQFTREDTSAAALALSN